MALSTYSTAALRTLLSHPDATIRAYADWALETRGEGWRSFPASAGQASHYETHITQRLAALAAANLAYSNRPTGSIGVDE